jgi:uncharacterized protein (DUF2132 family)
MEAHQTDSQKNNPLHGITLEAIITYMAENYTWEYLDEELRMNCFASNPSIKSCLKFLRKTPWARTKVESFYLYLKREEKRKGT